MLKHFQFVLFSLGSLQKIEIHFALIFFLKVRYIVLTARNWKFILTLTAVPSLSQLLTYVIFI